MSIVGDVFRAAGRFFWVTFYVMMFFFFIIFSKFRINSYVKYAIVFVVIAIQLYDIQFFFRKVDQPQGEYLPQTVSGNYMNSDKWNTIFSQFKNVVTFPLYKIPLVNHMDYQELAYYALKNNNNISAFYVARTNDAKMNEAQNQYIDELSNGIISNEDVFITNQENLKYFGFLYAKNLINVFNVDNYYVIFSKGKKLKKSITMSPQEQEAVQVAQEKYLTINKFTALANQNLTPGKVKFNLENIVIGNTFLKADGWAFNEDTKNNKGDSVVFILKNDNKTYISKPKMFKRPDLTTAFKATYLEDSGFNDFAFFSELEKGTYKLYIGIKTVSGKIIYTQTEQVINAGIQSAFALEKINEIPSLDATIKFGVDALETKGNRQHISGWALYENLPTENSTIRVLLIGVKGFYVINTKLVPRPDVTAALNKSNKMYDYCGFDTQFSTANLPKGLYKVAVEVKNGTKSNYALTDKYFEVE